MKERVMEKRDAIEIPGEAPELIKRAAYFADGAHAAVGQVRKYSGLPYIVHPREVAYRVAKEGGTEHMIAAAWLHDTVEDTNVTLEDIEKRFPNEVYVIVKGMTAYSKQVDTGLNRAGWKELDRQYLRDQSIEVQAVKCADVAANTRSIATEDPKFAKTYLVESYNLLASLNEVAFTKYADLWYRAINTVMDNAEKLDIQVV